MAYAIRRGLNLGESVAHSLAVLVSDVPVRSDAKEAVLANDFTSHACELTEVRAACELAIVGTQDAEVLGFTLALKISVQVGSLPGAGEHVGRNLDTVKEVVPGHLFVGRGSECVAHDGWDQRSMVCTRARGRPRPLRHWIELIPPLGMEVGASSGPPMQSWSTRISRGVTWLLPRQQRMSATSRFQRPPVQWNSARLSLGKMVFMGVHFQKGPTKPEWAT